VDLETTGAIDRLSDRIESFESSMRTELRDGLADVRRHAVILNEATRDDIRLVAEAVADLSVKVDSLQR
jgi:hypothetical protein